jgi:hypothetical protein
MNVFASFFKKKRDLSFARGRPANPARCSFLKKRTKKLLFVSW